MMCAISHATRIESGMKILYTAYVTATGGRDGRARSEDGSLDVKLSAPAASREPGTTTPEDLFAAGYAACFGSACQYAAREMNLSLASIEVRAAVRLGKLETGGFRLAINLDVHTRGLPQPEAERLVAAAHEVCPYSNAVKGNVDVTIKTSAI